MQSVRLHAWLLSLFVLRLTFVHMGFMALIATLVLCVRSQDSLMSVSVRSVHVVFSTAGFKGGGELRPETRETTALWRGIQ